MKPHEEKPSVKIKWKNQAPAACRSSQSSQARGQTGAAAAGLRHSQSNAMTQRPPRSTPQFKTMPDP